MQRKRHSKTALLALGFLAFSSVAGAQRSEIASDAEQASSKSPLTGEPAVGPVMLFQFGMLVRLDGVPTRAGERYYTGDAKDGAAVLHGNLGVLLSVGKDRWLGPAMVWTVNEVGGFVGLELRHRQRLRRDLPRLFPSLDLSAGVLVAGEVEDFPTTLPGFTAGVSYNVARTASFTARFDAYRYEQGGQKTIGSDLYLGVLTGSWLVLAASAAFLIALGSSWE